jgi:HEAT repeat protein
MAGSRNRLKLLHESLNENEAVSAIEFRRYLELLGWEALEGLVDLLGELQHEVHRRALCDHLVAHGREHIPLIGKGVFDKRWFVVRNAVMILAQIDDDRAVGYLEKAVGNPERRVRLEVLSALRHAVNPRAVQILKRAALDADSEIRNLAIDSLLAQPKSVAFGAVSELVADDRFDESEESSPQRILNAYSSLGGKEAVPYLKSLIVRRNLWRDRLLTFQRQAAFEALSHNRSEQAEALLVTLAKSWMPRLKLRAQAALKHRRDNIFGGDHDRS